MIFKNKHEKKTSMIKRNTLPEKVLFLALRLTGCFLLTLFPINKIYCSQLSYDVTDDN
jgi:hypothetical protein